MKVSLVRTDDKQQEAFYVCEMEAFLQKVKKETKAEHVSKLRLGINTIAPWCAQTMHALRKGERFWFDDADEALMKE